MKLVEIFDFTSTVDLTTGILCDAAIGFDFVPDNGMPVIKGMSETDAEELLRLNNFRPANIIELAS